MPRPSATSDLRAIRLRVWDLPTRLFHWALTLAVLGLAVSGTLGGEAMNLHFRLGYVVLALVLFRIVWGLIGGYWSRFSSFFYGPASLLAYLRGRGQPAHNTGHSPAGALSVFALLTILAAQVSSGLMSNDEIAFAGPLSQFISNANVSLATWYHKQIGKWVLLALVLMHLVAVAYYTWRKRSLVQAMVSGDKVILGADDLPGSRDDGRSRLLALLVFAACAGVAYAVASLEAPVF